MGKDVWGKGIPIYSDSDLMNVQETYEFAVQSTIPYMIDEGYEFVDAARSSSAIPSLVLKKNGKMYFVLVRTEIAVKHAAITMEEKRLLLDQSKKFDAIPAFAPIEIGSHDGDRFNKGLALRNDGFYINYTGIELIADYPIQ